MSVLKDLKDNFNELFKHAELESISKDSSDSAICLPNLQPPMKMICYSGFHKGERQGIKLGRLMPYLFAYLKYQINQEVQ